MPDAPDIVLCSKLCRHNMADPTMTCERGACGESKNCEILLFPTADKRFDTKVKCPTRRASFWVHCTELNASQIPGVVRGEWAVLELTGTLITNFLLQVREFLFLICVEATISMKILVIRVINSSRHRNCFVRGCIHSLFVSKALTRSYLARSGFHTNNS